MQSGFYTNIIPWEVVRDSIKTVIIDNGIVPVTNITNLPTTASTGTPLTLSGTVLPSNASFRNITWNVKDAGTTAANITGSSLNAASGGTVVIIATIADGLAIGTNYTQDFSITVNAVGIVETDNYPSLRVYPNPTNGQLRITNYGMMRIFKFMML